MPAIQREFQVTDGQLGLLSGGSFAIGMTLAIIPAGYLADRFDRRRILACGVFLWSLMTIACGYSTSYQAMFLARLGVGVGEAALTPAAYALVGEFVAADRRPRIISLLAIGSVGGSAAALSIGGALTDMTLPMLQSFEGWRASFIAVGLVGVIVAALPLALPASQPVISAQSGAPNVDGVIKFVRSNADFAVPYILGLIFLNLFAQGILHWLPTYFLRSFTWDAKSVGAMLGLIGLVAGVIGTLSVGWLATRLHQSLERDMTMSIMFFGTLALLMASVLSFSLDSILIAYAGSGLIHLLLASLNVLAPVAIIAVIPANLRARVLGIYAFSITATSQTFGAYSYGAFAEAIGLPDESFGVPFALLSALFLLACTVCVGLASRRYTSAITKSLEQNI